MVGERRNRIGAVFLALAAAVGWAMPVSTQAQLELFERLVMPGPLIADHVEYESDCGSCHVRFSRESQRTLCLDCHAEIADDLEAGAGFHGMSAEARGQECSVCHTDHEGRDADILGLVESEFDHDLTRFPLRDSHLEPECDNCHAVEATFHAAETECAGCHAADDRHDGGLGEACADCHRETVWADAVYVHDREAGFALTGAHEALACVSCHIDEAYVATPTTCNGCHLEDDSHSGANGTECRDCHTSTSWQTITFDHFIATRFALVDSHVSLQCDSCHIGNKYEETTPTECAGCHVDDDIHGGINGNECADCHNARDWLDVRFDHGLDTDFALSGSHTDIQCTDCHVEAVTVSQPSVTCFGCHEQDDPHAAQLGSDCGACHADLTWIDDVSFDHDLTRFPLLGRHGQADCAGCHESQAFLDASERCVDCHVEEDVHAERFGPACESCHVPIDWLAWRFDHDVQTSFPLDGAHAGLDCNGCHTEPVAALSEIEVTTDCAGCHRTDDVHRGEFGDDCAGCHRSSTFADVRVQR